MSVHNNRKVHYLDITGDPLHSRAACTQPCNVNTHSRAHCSPGARLCEQWGHGCVNNGARLCASARLCRGSPVDIMFTKFVSEGPIFSDSTLLEVMCQAITNVDLDAWCHMASLGHNGLTFFHPVLHDASQNWLVTGW